MAFILHLSQSFLLLSLSNVTQHHRHSNGAWIVLSWWGKWQAVLDCSVWLWQHWFTI